MLHDRAVLVRLERKAWSPYKFDRTATNEVEHLHKVAKAGRFNKHLFKGNTEFKKIQSALTNVYLYHTANTLPWMFDGVNILPSDKALEYVAKMNGLISDLFTTVRNFDLQKAMQEDQNRLGTLYDPNDYPVSQSEFEGKFGASYQFLPIPSYDDFRVSIPEEEKEKLQKQLDEVSTNITGEILNRVKGILEPIVSQCSKTEKTRWHKSLKTNILEAVPILRSFNLEGDSSIDEVIDKLEGFANSIDIEALKDNVEIRNEILERARSITHVDSNSGGDTDDVCVSEEPDYQEELNQLLESIK